MAIQLYALRIEKDREPSPFVWRSRLALAHKEQDVEVIPIGYGEKDKLAFSGQDRVPVLVDGDAVVADSWRIACYLEDEYPHEPTLFGGAYGRGEALFINRWADMVQLAALVPLVMPGTYDHVPAADKPYFWQSRLEWFGVTIDDMRAGVDGKLAQFRAVMEPVRQTLKEQRFLCGTYPGYADYCVFGGFQWARTVSKIAIVEAGDPVYDWRERILDLFDGMVRKAPAYDV